MERGEQSRDRGAQNEEIVRAWYVLTHLRGADGVGYAWLYVLADGVPSAGRRVMIGDGSGRSRSYLLLSRPLLSELPNLTNEQAADEIAGPPVSQSAIANLLANDLVV